MQINQLAPGQGLKSPDGSQSMQGGWPGQASVDQLVMQTDGNLVVYALTPSGSMGPAIWSSGTWGHPGAHAIAQDDGNFVVYDTNGSALWASGTWGSSGGTRLLADGDLLVGGVAGRLGWASGTREKPSQWCPANGSWGPGLDPTTFVGLEPREWMQSPNAWLVFQPDGNVVMYRKRDNAPIWSTGTWGTHSTDLFLQGDGNLVLNGSGYGYPGWASGTWGHPGDHAVFQTDGNFVIYDANGTALWSSGTWQTANQ
ncbi:hypothetical protein [Kitasatospora sp. NBC_01302]|uniref:hypothetical protein n=1 Tax=Kitasatospora sp. NBC_01302 TaxID=2903575 RepID=UPI002E12E85C|nr:hypothetical protein OG294_39370 [Kitasatospora sp. NBC_01302]